MDHTRKQMTNATCLKQVMHNGIKCMIKAMSKSGTGSNPVKCFGPHDAHAPFKVADDHWWAALPFLVLYSYN